LNYGRKINYPPGLQEERRMGGKDKGKGKGGTPALNVMSHLKNNSGED
jgi:hypothetical protein